MPRKIDDLGAEISGVAEYLINCPAAMFYLLCGKAGMMLRKGNVIYM